jgi:hypothetical protein
MQNFMRNPVVRFGKSMFNIPAAGGYIAGDKVGEALGIGELGRIPFGLAGSYAATKALPGLAAATCCYFCSTDGRSCISYVCRW